MSNQGGRVFDRESTRERATKSVHNARTYVFVSHSLSNQTKSGITTRTKYSVRQNGAVSRTFEVTSNTGTNKVHDVGYRSMA